MERNKTARFERLMSGVLTIHVQDSTKTGIIRIPVAFGSPEDPFSLLTGLLVKSIEGSLAKAAPVDSKSGEFWTPERRAAHSRNMKRTWAKKKMKLYREKKRVEEQARLQKEKEKRDEFLSEYFKTQDRESTPPQPETSI